MQVQNRQVNTRLVISGSRSITDYTWIRNTIEKFRKLDIELILGGARGVDSLAEKAAKAGKIQYTVFKADWNKYGKRAGYIRNEEMAANGDMLLAFWDGQSPGTAHMIKLMKTQRKPVIVRFPYKYNLWDMMYDYDAVCITTNGFVTRAGKAVMGRGNALQAKTLYPGLDTVLGDLIRKNGNITQVIKAKPTIISFPVKPQLIEIKSLDQIVEHARDKYRVGDTAPGFLAKADLETIEKSATYLAMLIADNGWKRVLLPRPGTGAGELPFDKVLSKLQILKGLGVDIITPNGIQTI